MKSVYLTLIGPYLLGLVAAANPGGVPPDPVHLDEVERTPPIAEPLMDDCNRSALEGILEDLEWNVQEKTPEEIMRRTTIPFCKEKLEKDAVTKLARVDDGIKERVNFLVESIYIPGGAKRASEGGTTWGILKAIEHNGTDLASIKSFDVFNTKYKAILADCDALHKELANVAYQYEVFLKIDSLQPEPVAAQWVKNTLICGFLKDAPTDYGNDAYRLLQQIIGLTQAETKLTPIKEGKRHNILKPFSRKSKS